jgi:hypothetical protein
MCTIGKDRFKSGAVRCLCSAFVLLSLCACQKDNNGNALPLRTVIIYMVADNNLDNFALDDINEMEQGWQEGLNGNLIVYVDRAKGANLAHPVVYKIAHDTSATMINSSIAKVYAEQNSSDATVMHRVLSDLIKDYPAQSYGLVLWSHGTAWLPEGAKISTSGKPQVVPQSFGNDNNREMNIQDLAVALPCRFDFIIFDACYMGAVEVIYELKDRADYILASPTEILSAGYPYRDIVELFFNNAVDYTGIANAFFESYNKNEGATRSASISVVKTAGMNKVAQVFGDILNDDISLKRANIRNVQQFSSTSSNLLFDFADFAAQITTQNNINALNSALAEAVIYKSATDKFLDALQITNFSGLSIFVPDASNLQYYDFYKNYKWFQDSRYNVYFDKYAD